MTSMPDFTPSGTDAARASRQSWIALAALLAIVPAISGCGLKIFGWQPLTSHSTAALPKVEGTSLDRELADARAQSALAPGEPYWPFRIAQLYAGADSTARAEAELKVSLAHDANYAPALSLLSRLYYQSRRHQEAIQLLEAARQRPKAFPNGVPQTLLAGLALHYDAIDRHDLAQQVMSEVTRPDPREGGPAFVYLTLRGDQPEGAGDLAARVVAENAKSAASQNNYGITRLRAGDPESARRAFEKAIDLDPSLPGPYYNLAILEKFYLLDNEAATRWFARYWEHSHDDPDGLAGAIGGVKDLAGKRDDKCPDRSASSGWPEC